MSGHKIKICFFIYSLEGGGAERVALYLLNHLTPDIFEKYLILFTKTGLSLKDLDPAISVFELDIHCKSAYAIPSISKFFKYLGMLKRINPDIVLSFPRFPNLLTVTAKIIGRFKSATVITEHTVLSLYLKEDKLSCIKKFLFTLLYPRADLIIAVSNGVKKDLQENLHIPAQKIKVIYNPIDLNYIASLAKKSTPLENMGRGPIVISVGRLVKVKNYFCALRAMHRIKDKISSYFILGDGPQREDILKFIKESHLEDKVHLLGSQENPFGYLSCADIFLLSSSFEGFLLRE